MKIQISDIRVAERIRKFTQRVDELAADMGKNGLINPVTVMPSGTGDNYQLLAGLRRLKAASSLGWTEIEATVVNPQDAEAQLNIEYSENVQREQFTFSEKMDYTRLIAEIEKAKAQERMLAGKKSVDPMIERSQGQGPTREIIGPKVGMSGPTYQRAKYVAEHAPQEMIDEIDKGEKAVTSAYFELRREEKKAAEPQYTRKTPMQEAPKASYTVKSVSPAAQPAPAPKALIPKSSVSASLSDAEEERIRRLREFDALPPEGKIAELQRQLKEERCRAATAETELRRLREQNHNDVLHRDSKIESLKMQLKAANEKIAELEAKHESD